MLDSSRRTCRLCSCCTGRPANSRDVQFGYGGGSKPMEIGCTTHFRTYLSGDWDVHSGMATSSPGRFFKPSRYPLGPWLQRAAQALIMTTVFKAHFHDQARAQASGRRSLAEVLDNSSLHLTWHLTGKWSLEEENLPGCQT